MRLKDLLSEFLMELQLQNYSNRTIKGYKNNVGALLIFVEKEFKVTELEKLNHQHIKMYIKNKQDNGLSECYINSIIKGVKAFYKYLIKEEYTDFNIIDRVSLLKTPITLIKTPTDKEVESLLKAFDFSDFLNARNKCVISVLVDTGIRNFELCNIRIDDVRDNYIIIKNGKGNKERVVPVSKNLKRILFKIGLLIWINLLNGIKEITTSIEFMICLA